MLVQRGTLRVGDIVVAGKAWGRVRALIDELGANVAEAGPSVPVEILGFDSAPEAGDQFAVVESESRAREITDYRVRKRRDTMGSAGTPRTLEQMMQSLKETGRKDFTLLVKGDVQGSVEAIAGSLAQARHRRGGGAASCTRASAASPSPTWRWPTRRRPSSSASTSAPTRRPRRLADRDGVEIRYYNIIYDLVDDVKAAMSGLLAPTIREIFLGKARDPRGVQHLEDRQGRRLPRHGRQGRARRQGASDPRQRRHPRRHAVDLKRFKDEVREVPAGQECGMAFANYQDIRAGDAIECFNVETVARSLLGDRFYS